LLSSLKIELPGTSPRVLFPPTPKWKNTNLLFSVRKACYFAFTKERSCFQTGIDKEKKHLHHHFFFYSNSITPFLEPQKKTP
jgi:hypothetical protein